MSRCNSGLLTKLVLANKTSGVPGVSRTFGRVAGVRGVHVTGKKGVALGNTVRVPGSNARGALVKLLARNGRGYLGMSPQENRRLSFVRSLGRGRRRTGHGRTRHVRTRRTEHGTRRRTRHVHGVGRRGGHRRRRHGHGQLRRCATCMRRTRLLLDGGGCGTTLGRMRGTQHVRLTRGRRRLSRLRGGVGGRGGRGD